MSDDNFFDYTGEPPAHWPEWMKAEWRKDNEFIKGNSWDEVKWDAKISGK